MEALTNNEPQDEHCVPSLTGFVDATLSTACSEYGGLDRFMDELLETMIRSKSKIGNRVADRWLRLMPELRFDVWAERSAGAAAIKTKQVWDGRQVIEERSRSVYSGLVKPLEISLDELGQSTKWKRGKKLTFRPIHLPYTVKKLGIGEKAQVAIDSFFEERFDAVINLGWDEMILIATCPECLQLRTATVNHLDTYSRSTTATNSLIKALAPMFEVVDVVTNLRGHIRDPAGNKNVRFSSQAATVESLILRVSTDMGSVEFDVDWGLVGLVIMRAYDLIDDMFISAWLVTDFVFLRLSEAHWLDTAIPPWFQEYSNFIAKGQGRLNNRLWQGEEFTVRGPWRTGSKKLIQQDVYCTLGTLNCMFYIIQSVDCAMTTEESSRAYNLNRRLLKFYSQLSDYLSMHHPFNSSMTHRGYVSRDKQQMLDAINKIAPSSLIDPGITSGRQRKVKANSQDKEAKAKEAYNRALVSCYNQMGTLLPTRDVFVKRVWDAISPKIPLIFLDTKIFKNWGGEMAVKVNPVDAGKKAMDWYLDHKEACDPWLVEVFDWVGCGTLDMLPSDFAASTKSRFTRMIARWVEAVRLSAHDYYKLPRKDLSNQDVAYQINRHIREHIQAIDRIVANVEQAIIIGFRVLQCFKKAHVQEIDLDVEDGPCLWAVVQREVASNFRVVEAGRNAKLPSSSAEQTDEPTSSGESNLTKALRLINEPIRCEIFSCTV
jgi:hypothetical protein